MSSTPRAVISVPRFYRGGVVGTAVFPKAVHAAAARRVDGVLVEDDLGFTVSRAHEVSRLEESDYWGLRSEGLLRVTGRRKE